MKFAQPIWLLAGLFACAVLLWRYRRFDARQRRELAKFASESLISQLTASVSVKRHHFKRGLIVLGVACLAVALARPLFGFRWQETNRKGLDLLFAVDTSKSMLAQDVKPDRLTRSKMGVEDLLVKLDGDRAGLIAFAGNAFLQCPLTLDYDAFRQSLNALDTKIIPRGGTDIATAIHEAEAALEGSGNNERILVLLTDGEDLEGSVLQAARAAAKKGLKIFTVGVGTASGELIPLPDEQGGTEFTKDASGQFVKSHLDETMLKQIAEATGAMYQPLGQQAQGLETIYQTGLAPFTRHKLASRMQKVYIERFQWPLAPGLLCLLVEPLIGLRRRMARKPAAASPSSLSPSWNELGRSVQTGAIAAAVFALLALTNSALASPSAGEKAFQKGDYAKAEQEYNKAASRSPDKPVLQFNHGSAAYKAGQFDVAAQSFGKAMKTDDLNLQEDNYYNLGNAQYRLGQKTEKDNPQETIKTWEQAVQSYEASLQLKPDDTDAKYNRDVVKRKLEELKKQEQQKQQQQRNNQQQSPDQNQDQNKQDQKSEKDQNKQDQQQNQQQSQDQGKPEDKKQQQNEQSGGGGHQDKQDQQEQANQKSDDKDKNGQTGEKPEQEKKDGQPKARNPQPNEPGPDQADAQREPGKMSREEARQLLDSLKSGDRKMPLGPNSRGNGSSRDDDPLKDW